jgi:thiol peroxidase
MATRTVEFKGKMFPLVGPELKIGDKAPDFACVSSALEVVGLANTPGKSRLFSVVPSLDTPVCSEQTRKFDQALAGLKDQVACYTISLDLPFAQKRFCTNENITNMQTLSDTHNHSFGKSYGVLIEGLPLSLLSRAIFVLDKTGKISYVEYVPSVPSHPNYDKAIAAIKAAVA